MRIEEKKALYEFLEKEGYIDYGHIIPRDVLLQLFKTDNFNSWEFLGPFLSMKQYIEEQGYLCTSEGLEYGNLRIYDADEIADRANNIFTSVVNKLKRLHICLLHTKYEDFSNRDFMKHLHTTNKISATLNSLHSKLNDI